MGLSVNNLDMFAKVDRCLIQKNLREVPGQIPITHLSCIKIAPSSSIVPVFRPVIETPPGNKMVKPRRISRKKVSQKALCARSGANQG